MAFRVSDLIERHDFDEALRIHLRHNLYPPRPDWERSAREALASPDAASIDTPSGERSGYEVGRALGLEDFYAWLASDE